MTQEDFAGLQRLADDLTAAAGGAVNGARRLAEHNAGLVRTCREIHNDLQRAVELLGKVMARAEPVFLESGSGFEPDEYVIPVSVYEDVCAFLADRAARLAEQAGGEG